MSKTLFLLPLLCGLAGAEHYSVRCNNSTHNGLTFEPSDDGVEGRYTVDWCTTADRNVTNWELVMRYDDRRLQEKCIKYNVGTNYGRVHSRFDRLVNVDLNCTNVCFSTNLDLVFNGTCYHIKSWLQRGTKSSAPHDSLHYIINESTKEHFTKSEARFAHFNNDETFVVQWYFGYVPVTEFKVELCTEDYSQCVDVCANCTVSGAEGTEVRCELRGGAGCRVVRLDQLAPWSVALSLFPRHVHLQQHVCNTRPPPVPAEPRLAPWPALAAVTLAALLLLVFICLQRARLEAWRVRVLRDWRDRRADPAGKPLTEAEERRRILLLYARDCPPFAALAAQLRALLAEGTGCQVIDLYSADTVRAAAAAPSEWLQAALGGARVVLLQSPAARALYAPAAPLRGAAVRAAPHSGDWLLALALRRLAESGHAGLPYRRYFVVEVAGLEAEVLPHLTQLRRYSLPSAAELLLQDLALPQQQQQQQQQLAERLQQLSAAVDELNRYVRENPDYIVDLFQIY